MAFEITHISDTGVALYAFLFDAADRTKAWNTDTASFEVYDSSLQSDFALHLEEDEQRSGFYAYMFESDIPSVTADSYYFIEIWQQGGDNVDRASDELVGTLQFFWDGTKEIPPFAAGTTGLTAAEVWANVDRTLTSTLSPSAKEIWEYVNRTLTENTIADLLVILSVIQTSLQSLTERVSALETASSDIKTNTEQIKEDVKKTTVTVNPQSPRVSPNGVSGPSNIRVR